MVEAAACYNADPVYKHHRKSEIHHPMVRRPILAAMVLAFREGKLNLCACGSFQLILVGEVIGMHSLQEVLNKRN